MRKMHLLLILLMAIFTVGSISAATLPEGEWRLASYNFAGKDVFPASIEMVTLNIHANGKLGGTSGCNVYGGSYKVEHGKLKIGDLISTMMACDESSMEFEQQFSKTLQNADKFAVTDGILTLTDPKTHNFMSFKPVVHPNKCPPMGT